jgi:hypothetical protein
MLSASRSIHRDIVFYGHKYPQLAEAWKRRQWRPGAHCTECEFLERCQVPGGVDQWRCANGWHDYWSAWYSDLVFWLAEAIRIGEYETPLDRVPDDILPFPRYDVNPGSFACWLFRPGESMSARAWRAGRWPEYLALRALAGEPFAQKETAGYTETKEET